MGGEIRMKVANSLTVGVPRAWMALHAEGLHRGQTGLPALKALEDLLVKMQLEFGIHVKKSVFQHDMQPSFPQFSLYV